MNPSTTQPGQTAPGKSTQAAATLFVYGTLMIPQVMTAVTGRHPLAEPARLPDYARYGLEGKSYPGMVPEAGAVTEGILYRDLDPVAVVRLDHFEGDLYTRQPVVVHPTDGRTVSATAYILRPEHRRLLTGRPWDIARFRRHDLAGFLERYSGFARIEPSPGAPPHPRPPAPVDAAMKEQSK